MGTADIDGEDFHNSGMVWLNLARSCLTSCDGCSQTGQVVILMARIRSGLLAR